MVPALTFEAAGGLFLAFLSIHPLLAYYEATSENFVGSLWCSECDDHMATGLTCCSVLLLYPILLFDVRILNVALYVSRRGMYACVRRWEIYVRPCGV